MANSSKKPANGGTNGTSADRGGGGVFNMIDDFYMQDGMQDGNTSTNNHQQQQKMPQTSPPFDTGSGQDSRGSRKYPRISLPVEMMRDSYNVVVIGTGYGGGVAASRMARGGKSVCVLERGRERWPGEFPEALADAAREVRVSGELAPGDRRSVPGKLLQGRGGNPTGMYQFMVGDGQNVYMSYGLGGTSQVNANVFLEATPGVLEMGFWPEELRGAKNWTKYYDRASSVLEPTQYPATFPELPKAQLLKKQAELMGFGGDFYRVRQTTRFEDGPNGTGVSMRKSTLSGMDATGINDGSKSTTLVTYLSDAWNWGAEMFCECEVRYVTRAPEERGGYLVWFAWHGAHRGRFRESFYEDLMWVHARELVFFGAGSIGTTEMLLRSKALGLAMSDEVGTDMSGNGDMLGFGYNTDEEANCLARPNPSPDKPVGPCITAVLDLRNTGDNPLEGFVVQDCSIPLALAPFLFPIMEYLPEVNRPTYEAFRQAVKDKARLESRLFGPYVPTGSLARTPAYLVMSHDSSQGVLTLDKDRPVLSYSGVGRSDSTSRVNAFLKRMTDSVGGNLIANPAITVLGGQQVTVHPIGGARVSPDGTGDGGVVNHMGEVFTGNGSETYPGLVVCDGSAIPAAVGVNPFATITAFAERSVELVAKKHGIEIDYETKNGVLDMFGSPAHSFPRDRAMGRLAQVISMAEDNGVYGVGFSEVMSGYIHAGGDVADFDIASKLARSRCEAARFFLSVKSWDTSELLNSFLHRANLTGTFVCQGLGGTFMVQRGTFQLFSQDSRQPDTANLVYDFDMVSPAGKKLHFNGYKVVNTASYLSVPGVWKQTTTLYVTITDAAAPAQAQVVGRGTLHIQPSDFIQEVQTFQPTGPTVWSRLMSTSKFLTYFTKQLSVPFFSTLGRLQWPNEGLNISLKQTPPSQTISLEAADGVKTTMLMWNPLGEDGAEIFGRAPAILFLPGAAVDHTIFALPTIEKNAVTYFREAGYRAYCVTHRVGRTPVAFDGYTPYDARRDIYAALAHIRKVEGARAGGGGGGGGGQEPEKVYVVAHCAGSVALACGMLDGTIPAEWIRGVTASMVFMNPKFGMVDYLLSRFSTDVYKTLVGDWWDCCSSQSDTYLQQLFNQVLRLYPVGDARETCRSVVCHRSELVFGRLWSHKNLNEATHRNLDQFLGGTSMQSLAYLMKCGRAEYVSANGPAYNSLVTPDNIDRLKGVPMLFISGTENMVYTPENTDKSYTTLCNAHGRQWYERELFAGKGHLDAWMGAAAYRDVYPRVRRHVDKVMKGAE